MSKDSPEEIEEAFRAFDIEGTGLMTLDNLKQISHELGQDLSVEELREMMAEANKLDEAK